jgi:DNA-binding IclR family transcriptional regulator
VDSYTHCFAASVINERRECIATLCVVVPRVEAHRRYESLKSALIGEAQSLSSTLGGRGIVDVKLDVT